MDAVKTLQSAALILRESGRSFLRNADLQTAAAMAYYTFLAFIPLCLLAVALLGILLASSDSALTSLETLTTQTFPLAADAILKEVSVLARHRTWGILGLALLLWSVTPLASSFRTAFGTIFNMVNTLPYWKGKLRDVGGALVLVLLLILLTVIKVYDPFPAAWMNRFPVLLRALKTGFLLLLALGGLGLFYRILAPVKLKAGHAAAGAIASALLLGIVSPLFALVLRMNPEYGVTFGSLKGLFLIIIWIYYSFTAVLFGIEVMANTWRKEALVVKRLLDVSPRSSDRGQRPSRDRSARALKPNSLLRSFIREFGADELVFREGDTAEDMFYIISGRVALSKNDRIIRELTAGEHFGELAMLIATPRTATARALEAGTQLAVIARVHFETVMTENPKIVFSVLREMAQRLKTTTERSYGENT